MLLWSHTVPTCGVYNSAGLCRWSMPHNILHCVNMSSTKTKPICRTRKWSTLYDSVGLSSVFLPDHRNTLILLLSFLARYISSVCDLCLQSFSWWADGLTIDFIGVYVWLKNCYILRQQQNPNPHSSSAGLDTWYDVRFAKRCSNKQASPLFLVSFVQMTNQKSCDSFRCNFKLCSKSGEELSWWLF